MKEEEMEFGEIMQAVRDERRRIFQPERMEHAIKSLQNIGIEPTKVSDSTLVFTFKDAKITFYPYTGWATGKTIKDCRGLRNLLSQIKKKGI